MTNQHPITPTPELLEQWEAETAHTTKDETWHVAVQAARWGADQELEACCEWMRDAPFGLSLNTSAYQLRAARRPKPPSLKEQALDELTSAERLYPADWSTIRRALEALPND
jgi:hypothetical protein